METSKKVVNFVVTIIILVALGFGIYYLIGGSGSKAPAPKVSGNDYYVSQIDVKHQYKDGKHIYVGSVDLPNACYKLESNISKTSNTEGLLTLSTSVNNEEFCAEVVSTKVFRTEISAESTFNLKGVLNGKELQLNIFEVPVGMDIDGFQINVKG